MEIISNAPAATAAKSNANNQAMANAHYAKSLMASRALQSNGTNNEVNIANLEPGDVFKGEITNISGKTVKVSLGSGQTLTALMLENVSIHAGNSLYFEVKENDGERVTIRPLTGEKFSPRNQTIEKSLQSAGLQLNEKNMAVVKELMDASMPIDRNSIMKILQQLVNHQGANIKTVVAMTKCGIEITPESMAQFEQYMSKQHYLSQQIDGVIESIHDMFSAFDTPDAFAGDALRLHQQLLSVLGEPAVSSDLQVTLQETFGMTQEEVMPQMQQSMALELDQDGNVLMDSLGNRYPQGSLLRDEQGNLVLDSNGQLQFTEEFLQQMSADQKEALTNGMFYSAEEEPQSIFTNDLQKHFASVLTELGMDEETVNRLLQPNRQVCDVLEHIQNFLTESMTVTDEVIKQFFASKEYAFLLDSVIDKQWKLTPEQVKNKEDVMRLFERAEKQSRQLADLGKQFSSTGEQLSQNARNMNDNLHFMQMLNDKYTYAQLPLQLTNQDANGELFVYTNKKTLEKNKKDISVLLHLDMEHLGATDVHVQLVDKKVMARFYMEDQRSLNTIKNHIDQLSHQILALGLSLETEVVRRTDKTEQVENFVDDFLAKDLPASQQVKRYNFDMRA